MDINALHYSGKTNNTLYLLKFNYKIMEKEIRIIPPKGYEIDNENSTFECIKFKPIVKKWRDNSDATFFGYYIERRAYIAYTEDCINEKENYNVFATEKLAKSALALARISQIMANDSRFGGIVTEKEWNDINIITYCIYYSNVKNSLHIAPVTSAFQFISFHTKAQAELFLIENKDLLEDYFMI